MDLDKGILLAQAVAWPMVALAVAPFVIWRLGAVARLYDGIKSGEFVTKISNAAERLEKLDGILGKVGKLDSALHKVQENVELLKESWLEEATARLEKESALLAQRKEVEQIQSEKQFQPENELSSEQLYKRMQDAWKKLNQIVEAKLKSIGKPFDARSLRLAIAPLMDGSRSNPLSESDAEFIAKVQGQFNSFRRLKGTKDDWLTPNIYSSFIASTAVAEKLVSQSA
jgi:hypothetical protein